MKRKEYWNKKKYGVTKILYDLLCKTNWEVVWINENCIGFKMNEFESFIIRIGTKNKNDLDFQYELAKESAREKMYNEMKKHEEKMQKRRRSNPPFPLNILFTILTVVYGRNYE